jgi:hypothetical protein
LPRTFALASIVVVLGTALAVPSFADGGKHWVATWATSPATFFVYTAPPVPVYPPGAPTTFAPANIQPDLVFPFPDAATSGATANNQTFRSIIKPDLWGNTMRFRFSNTFGSQPVTFSTVTVGLQEYSGNVVDGTMVRVTFGGSRSVTILTPPPSQPRQFAVTIAVRSWWLCGLRKAEPVQEHKESGIILDLTRCGQRLNNRAAILRSKKSVMGTGVTPAEESAGAGGAIVEAASQRVTRLGVVLARRPPSASPSSRSMPEPNTGDRNSHGSGVEEFRTAKLRRGSPDVCPGPGCGEDDRRLLRFSNGF